jgi:hypothetical protein
MATLEELETMLAVDGYTLSVETADGKTKAVISAGEGICEDCLVPEVVMTGLLAQAMQVPAEQITLHYPASH